MKYPDFNEWINTRDGKGCNNMDTLTGQPFLQNRLFWAFDAGRNCIWDQLVEAKAENVKLTEILKELDRKIEPLKNDL